MVTALVTDGQIRSALAAIRSLGRQGVTVVCGESTRFATSFASKYVSERLIYPSPEKRPDEFVSFLETYLARNDVDILLPIAHQVTRLISRHQERLRRHTTVPLPERDIFEQFLRKDVLLEHAQTLGVPHPKTIRPANTAEAVEKVAALTFPVVIKPVESSGSRGIRFVTSKTEFRDAYQDVSSRYAAPLVQEQIPRHGQGMGCAFLIWNGEVKAQFAYQRLREYPPNGGPSTLRESIHNDRILDYGRKLLLDADWEGVAMVEFKNDPRTNIPQLMEVNPRFWGSLHLPLAAGIDFPWLLVRCALGDDVAPQLSYPAGVRCRFLLPGDLLYLFSKRDRNAVANFLPLISDGLHYDVLDADDPLPTAGRFVAMLRYAIDVDMWKRVVFRSKF